MTDTLDRATIEKAYARWAPVYDLVFGKVFEREVIKPAALGEPDRRIDAIAPEAAAIADADGFHGDISISLACKPLCRRSR